MPTVSLPSDPIFGINVTVHPSGNRWGDLQVNYVGQTDPSVPANFRDTWIIPQLDAAASMGSNAVRMIMGLQAVMVRGLDPNIWIKQSVEVARLAAARGMYFSPSFDAPAYSPYDYDIIEDALPHIVSFWKAMASEPNVKFSSVVNEYYSSVSIGYITFSKLEDNIVALLEAIRKVAPHVAFTFDAYQRNGNTAGLDPILSFCEHYDYIDVHAHAVGEVNGIANDIYSNPNTDGKRFIIGEMGVSRANTESERAAYYRRLGHAAVSDDRCHGSLAWAGFDQSTDPEDQWGLFNSDKTPRSVTVAAYKEYPRFFGDGSKYISQTWQQLGDWTVSNPAGVASYNNSPIIPNEDASVAINAGVLTVFTAPSSVINWSTYKAEYSFSSTDGGNFNITCEIAGIGVIISANDNNLYLYRFSDDTILRTVAFVPVSNKVYKIRLDLRFGYARVTVLNITDGTRLVSNGTFVAGDSGECAEIDGIVLTSTPSKITVFTPAASKVGKVTITGRVSQDYVGRFLEFPVLLNDYTTWINPKKLNSPTKGINISTDIKLGSLEIAPKITDDSPIIAGKDIKVGRSSNFYYVPQIVEDNKHNRFTYATGKGKPTSQEVNE